MSDKKLWEQYVALEKERDTLRSGLAEFQYGAAVANDTIKALQAKIEQMEQPAPSIPDDVMRDANRYRFLRAAKNIPISTEAARDPVVYDAAIDAAMLARAPEAKP